MLAFLPFSCREEGSRGAREMGAGDREMSREEGGGKGGHHDADDGDEG